MQPQCRLCSLSVIKWSLLHRASKNIQLHYAMCQIGKGDARPLEKEQPQISNNMFHTRNRGGHETAVTKSVPSLNMWTSQLQLQEWKSDNNSCNLFVKAVVNSCAVRPLNFGGIVEALFETLHQNVGAPQHRNSPNWVKSANVVCCTPRLLYRSRIHPPIH